MLHRSLDHGLSPAESGVQIHRAVDPRASVGMAGYCRIFDRQDNAGEIDVELPVYLLAIRADFVSQRSGAAVLQLLTGLRPGSASGPPTFLGGGLSVDERWRSRDPIPAGKREGSDCQACSQIFDSVGLFME